MTVVLDASALLAFLQAEAGADTVEEHLEDGAICGAANWSETAQKVLGAGGDWGLAKALLASYDLRIEAVLTADAEWAAAQWRRGEGLSLGDRLCLGLAHRLDAEVWTADASWGESERIHQIR